MEMVQTGQGWRYGVSCSASAGCMLIELDGLWGICRQVCVQALLLLLLLLLHCQVAR